MEETSRFIANATDSQGVDFLQFQSAIFGADEPQTQGFFGGFLEFFRDFVNISTFSTPGGIISRFLPFVLSAAGLILFVMLIWGSFEFMMGASNPKSAESGKQRITSAFIGFFILFSVFWIAQIMQIIFGIDIGIQ